VAYQGVTENTAPSAAYIASVTNVSEQRVVLGGLRLATVLTVPSLSVDWLDWFRCVYIETTERSGLALVGRFTPGTDIHILGQARAAMIPWPTHGLALCRGRWR
jgi:hypothetical protein